MAPMTPPSLFKAIGLMSGTSMDGIDVAFIETDGEARLALGPHASLPYPAGLRHTLLRLPGNGIDVETVEREVTDLQSRAVRALCVDNNIDLPSVSVVGFHGQTIKHDPQRGKTWQLGDGQLMADTLGCPVVNNFRQNDLDNGGQGALVP
jgi:anhydro-N-acetylmuramic acid kinase